MIGKRTFGAALAAIGLVLCVPTAGVAQTYPSKPIKLIVPLPAGGTVDVSARVLAERLAGQLGQSVIVDNRPGAGTTIGLKLVAGAEPDGYTLLFASTGSMAVNPALYKNLDFAPIRSLTPVASLAAIANILGVAPSVPAQTVAELVAHAKANPGKLSHGASLGTPPHLLGEYVRARTVTDIVYVPYRGTAQALTDLLGGRIQITAESPAVLLPYISDGRLRPLLVTSTARLAELPDVPTMHEVGLDGYPPETWMGVVAPPGTADTIVRRLNGAINDVLNSAETKASLAKIGFTAKPGTPQEFAALIASDVERWGAVVALTGAKGD
jgi:tripartite-type tricarboxylate transporter receptor subunit TctC